MEGLGMEFTTVYRYPDGINANNFGAISKMLLKGTSVEFNCGASQYGSRGSAENNVQFQKHVQLWVGYIQSRMKEDHGFTDKLEYDYCSKDDWTKVRVHSPMDFKSNIKAKRLLSKEY
jgi:hypothetical protein